MSRIKLSLMLDRKRLAGPPTPTPTMEASCSGSPSPPYGTMAPSWSTPHCPVDQEGAEGKVGRPQYAPQPRTRLDLGSWSRRAGKATSGGYRVSAIMAPRWLVTDGMARYQRGQLQRPLTRRGITWDVFRRQRAYRSCSERARHWDQGVLSHHAGPSCTDGSQ